MKKPEAQYEKIKENVFSCIPKSFLANKPLNPNSDQHQISPCNMNAYSTPEVMGIKDMITQGEFSWYFDNFSSVLLWEKYGDKIREFVPWYVMG